MFTRSVSSHCSFSHTVSCVCLFNSSEKKYSLLSDLVEFWRQGWKLHVNFRLCFCFYIPVWWFLSLYFTVAPRFCPPAPLLFLICGIANFQCRVVPLQEKNQLWKIWYLLILTCQLLFADDISHILFICCFSLYMNLSLDTLVAQCPPLFHFLRNCKGQVSIGISNQKLLTYDYQTTISETSGFCITFWPILFYFF